MNLALIKLWIGYRWKRHFARHVLPFFTGELFQHKQKAKAGKYSLDDELRGFNNGFKRPESSLWRDVYYPVDKYGVTEYLTERYAVERLALLKPSLGLDE